MSVLVNVLKAGTNNYQTPAEGVDKLSYWMFTEGVPAIGAVTSTGNQKTGDFAVQAQTSPNKTVKIKSGKYLMKATPTSESERMFSVELSSDFDLTLADNATGSTKYDKIILVLDADSLHNPPANGDLTEASSIVSERHNSANETVTTANAVEIAEITVSNGFSSILDTNIADKRESSTLLASAASTSNGWTPFGSDLTYNSGNLAGSGFLSNNAVGDKFWCQQSIPLTSYWPLISNLTDLKSGYNGTGTDVTYAAGGKFGNAVAFNGTTSKIVISDTANLKPTDRFTIEVWTKTSTPNRTFFQSHNAVSGNYYGIQFLLDASGYATAIIGNGTSAATVLKGSVNLADGVLHSIKFSYQSNVLKIFVDNTLAASGYSVAPVYHATNYVRIGCQNENGSDASFFNGQIGAITFINGYAADLSYSQARYALTSDPGVADVTVNQYGYVGPATTDTLLNFVGGADYVLYNGPILNPYYSHSNAVGYPVKFAYSPTFTGFSVNPVVTAYFWIKDRICYFETDIASPGTSNANTYTQSLPVAAVLSNNWIAGVGSYTTSGGSGVSLGRILTASPSIVQFGVADSLTGWPTSSTKYVFFNGNYPI